MRRIGATLALLPFVLRLTVRLDSDPMPTWLIVWIASVVACLGTGVLLLAVAWLLGRRRHRLGVHDGQLWLDGASLCRLDQIRDVLILSPLSVRLSFPGGPLVVAATDQTAVTDIVDGLPHVIARSRRWGYMRTAPFSTFKLPRIVRIEVGADGILLRGLGRKRFIPRAAIATVSRVPRNDRPGSLVLTFNGAAPPIELVGIVDDEGLEAEVRRLLEPMTTSTGPETYRLLTRGQRPAAEWIASLRTLLRPGAEYRGNLTPEQLRQVAEDAGAPPSARAGATLALRLAGQPGPRIHDEQASPLVRVALEASDEELASRLEQEATEATEATSEEPRAKS